MHDPNYDGEENCAVAEFKAIKNSGSWAEQATTLRARLTEALAPACEVLTEAVRAGFVVQYSTGLDQFGRISVLKIEIMRQF